MSKKRMILYSQCLYTHHSAEVIKQYKCNLKSPPHPTLISFSCLLPLVIAILNLVVFIPMPFSILVLNSDMSISIKICNLVSQSHKMVSRYELRFCNLLCSLSILEIYPYWYMYSIVGLYHGVFIHSVDGHFDVSSFLLLQTSWL